MHYKGKAIGYLEFTQFTQGSADELRYQVQKMVKAYKAPIGEDDAAVIANYLAATY